jgi:cation diffusion facilitator CzcD-associated flavoprotein CzcO
MTGVHDVAVIGAGPYGLAATSHLRARGLAVHPFGRPMDLWERMPVGMLLRSSWEASTISDPHRALTLDAYEAAHSVRIARTIPLDDFLRYARWYRGHAVPDVDTRRVVDLQATGPRFELGLEDGDAVHARHVVIATGPAGHAHRPRTFAGLTAPAVRHSSELVEPGEFAGQRTAIVGSGQSAIELAALLHEAGADVEVIARADRIRWLRRSGWLHGRDGLLRQLLYPPTDVGPVGLSHLVAVPNAFRRVPVRLGERIAYRCIRPAAAGWLVDRTAAVRLTLRTGVVSATHAGDRVRLALDDGTARELDRVVLATGFDIRADRHPLLGSRLCAQLRTHHGAPLLGDGLESSVPGLHFVGAFAAHSYGPVMRFVSGTPFTGRALARHLGGARRPVALRPEPASASV